MKPAVVILLVGTVSLGLASSPIAATTIYGLVDTGEVFASSDGGVTWDVLSTLPVPDAVGLIAGENQSDLTLLTTRCTVYRSTDAGVTWNAIGTVSASEAVDLVVQPSGSLVVLTATGSVLRSTDDGAGWQAIATLPASEFVSLAALQDGSLYALTRTGQVVSSDDGGVSWISATGITVSNAVDIRGRLINGSEQAELYVLTATGDVFNSSDLGSSWNAVSTLSQTGMCGLTLTYDGLAAATQEGEVAVSADGVNWTWVGTMNQVWVRALCSDYTVLSATPLTFEPTRVSLGTPWPNPGDGATTTFFPVILNARAEIQLQLFDLRGRKVAERPRESFGSPGEYNLPWQPGDLPSGVYFVRLTTLSGSVDTARWVVIR